jgi:hypothetical protein
MGLGLLYEFYVPQPWHDALADGPNIEKAGLRWL